MELTEYYRLMAVLETQASSTGNIFLSKTTSSNIMATTVPTSNNNVETTATATTVVTTEDQVKGVSMDQMEVDNAQNKDMNSTFKRMPYLTLRRLFVWLMEPTRKMRKMALLIDSTEFIIGGALASTIHTHSKIGINEIFTLFKNTLNEL